MTLAQLCAKRQDDREQGYGLSVDPYFYIATTKGTDPAILSTLTKAIKLPWQRMQ